MTNIAICAPARAITKDHAAKLEALVEAEFPDHSVTFHDQCFERSGHFAGDDLTRLGGLLDCANDPAFDAVWFARGGYGSNRIAEAAIARIVRRADGTLTRDHRDTDGRAGTEKGHTKGIEHA